LEKCGFVVVREQRGDDVDELVTSLPD
jgi:hypothetical protein